MAKEYDYLLKVLLVGDSDVGKTEILNNLDEDPMNEEGDWRNSSQIKNFLNSRFALHFSNIQDYNHTAGWQTSEATGESTRFEIDAGFSYHAISWNFLSHQPKHKNRVRSGTQVARVDSAQSSEAIRGVPRASSWYTTSRTSGASRASTDG